METADLALKINKIIHDECKDAPHDIGLRIIKIAEQYAQQTKPPTDDILEKMENHLKTKKHHRPDLDYNIGNGLKKSYMYNNDWGASQESGFREAMRFISKEANAEGEKEIKSALFAILKIGANMLTTGISGEIDEWDLPKTTPIKAKRKIVQEADKWNEVNRQRAVELKRAYDVLCKAMI